MYYVNSFVIKIVVLIAFVVLLFLYPYSKPIKKFKAEDVNWEIINKTNAHRQFNPSRFTFEKKYNFSDGIQALNGKLITIKGFFKKEKHGSKTSLLLTETVTEVCFMCNHDEMHLFIELIPRDKESPLYGIADDVYAQVTGTFKINHDNNFQSPFSLEDAQLLNIIEL